MEDTNNNTTPFQIFVKLLNGKTATLRFTNPYPNAQSIKTRIHQITKIPTNIQLLVSNGKKLRQNSVVTTPDSTIHLLLPLLGGKGGFGSLLRGSANKAGQKKTNNFDACRDMSGRRLRHVNAEKRLEEWKAEQEERKLEKIAEDFIKKNANKGKKGVGDGAAEKYVAKYREESARCAKQVEDAVKEACSVLGNGKRKGEVGEVEGLDSKRLKIWMGKRKLAESDSEDSSDYEEDEKSVVLNSGNPVVIKEADVSSDSVTGGKRDGELSGGASYESGFEEDKDAVAIEQNLKLSPQEEIVPSKGNEVVEPEIHEVVVPSAGVTGSEAADTVRTYAVDSVEHENDTSDSPAVQALAPVTTEVAESKPMSADSDIVANADETHFEKPFNFDDFNSAADMEALGMERLKNELQARGLKCGGTLQERAARLFLLKTAPLEKLPKKLLAKK